MDISWLDSEPSPSGSLGAEKALVKRWMREHEAEAHEISHIVEELEVEVVKVLSGEQEVDREGKNTIRTLELHFIKGLMIVERVVETQAAGTYASRRTTTQLGHTEAPICGGCCSSSPKKK